MKKKKSKVKREKKQCKNKTQIIGGIEKTERQMERETNRKKRNRIERKYYKERETERQYDGKS